MQHDEVVLFVSGGNRVVISAPDAETRLAYDYLVYASAPRLLMWQQRRFNLHATLVVDPFGHAFALSGASMAGKSTTSAELLRRGWTFGCDDVVEVEHRHDAPWAIPHPRPVHLSDDAASMLGAPPSVGRPLPWRGKRVYSLAGDLAPRPLKGLFHLVATDCDRVAVTRPSALSHLPALVEQNDFAGICRLADLASDYLTWTVGLAERVPFLLVERPTTRDTVEEVADQVEAAAFATASEAAR